MNHMIPTVVLQIVQFFWPRPHLVMAYACHLNVHTQYVPPYNKVQYTTELAERFAL